MTTINRQVLLASRPDGEPTVDNFRLVETPVPALAAQQGFAERFARDAQRFNPRQEQAEDVPAPNAGHGR